MNNCAFASDGTPLYLFDIVHIPTGIKLWHTKEHYGDIEYDRYYYYDNSGDPVHIPKTQIHWIGEKDYGKQF